MIFQYKQTPYDLINAEFSLKSGDTNQNLGGIIFLPNLLIKYMNFKECEPFIFKNRWKLKKANIIKSEVFFVN